jgi:hypothetical protein
MAARAIRFRRGEQHQQSDFFLDVVEAVFDAGGDEDDRSLVHGLVLRARAHPGLAVQYVVKLVLPVRRLPVGAACPQDVDAGAHRCNAQKLEIRVAAPSMLRRDRSDVQQHHVWIAHRPPSS